LNPRILLALQFKPDEEIGLFGIFEMASKKSGVVSMKKLAFIASFIIVTGFFSVKTYSAEPDGRFWLAMDNSTKLIFITGWMGAGLVLSEYARIIESEFKDRLRKLESEFSHMKEREKMNHPVFKERMIFLTHLYYEQKKLGWIEQRIVLNQDPIAVVNNLNTFYDDNANRQIPVAWAIYYVLESMRGESEKVLENYRTKIRRMASEGSCLPLAPVIPR
jgi:hypothetical protein